MDLFVKHFYFVLQHLSEMGADLDFSIFDPRCQDRGQVKEEGRWRIYVCTFTCVHTVGEFKHSEFNEEENPIIVFIHIM